MDPVGAPDRVAGQQSCTATRPSSVVYGTSGVATGSVPLKSV